MQELIFLLGQSNSIEVISMRSCNLKEEVIGALIELIQLMPSVKHILVEDNPSID
jgi:hypothetical protein